MVVQNYIYKKIIDCQNDKKTNEGVGEKLNKTKEIGLKYKEVLYVNQFVWPTSRTLFCPYVIYDWS